MLGHKIGGACRHMQEAVDGAAGDFGLRGCQFRPLGCDPVGLRHRVDRWPDHRMVDRLGDAFAEDLDEIVAGDAALARVEVSGPGFINLRLDASLFHSVVKSILNDREAYGRSTKGKREKVNVEFVSANPTGPMHVGHGRGAVFGDALVQVQDTLSPFGMDVITDA